MRAMLFQSRDRRGAPPALAAAADDHNGIKRIGRLVLLCAGVLIVSAALLVFTALQVLRSIDTAELAAERLRAVNAIQGFTTDSGPLTEARAQLLGRVAGLRNAHLATGTSTDPGLQQIPLL